MSDNIETLVLEQLRRVNGRVNRLELDFGDIKFRMSAASDHLASVVMSVAGLNARLDLTEAH